MSHPHVEPRWPVNMEGPRGQRRIGFTCPQCRLPVLLTPVLVMEHTGALLLAAPPLVHAMALHMRVGCARR